VRFPLEGPYRKFFETTIDFVLMVGFDTVDEYGLRGLEKLAGLEPSPTTGETLKAFSAQFLAAEALFRAAYSSKRTGYLARSCSDVMRLRRALFAVVRSHVDAGFPEKVISDALHIVAMADSAYEELRFVPENRELLPGSSTLQFACGYIRRALRGEVPVGSFVKCCLRIRASHPSMENTVEREAAWEAMLQPVFDLTLEAMAAVVDKKPAAMLLLRGLRETLHHHFPRDFPRLILQWYKFIWMAIDAVRDAGIVAAPRKDGVYDKDEDQDDDDDVCARYLLTTGFLDLERMFDTFHVRVASAVPSVWEVEPATPLMFEGLDGLVTDTFVCSKLVREERAVELLAAIMNEGVAFWDPTSISRWVATILRLESSIVPNTSALYSSEQTVAIAALVAKPQYSKAEAAAVCAILKERSQDSRFRLGAVIVALREWAALVPDDDVVQNMATFKETGTTVSRKYTYMSPQDVGRFRAQFSHFSHIRTRTFSGCFCV
jgi:hypothetical protein